MHPPDPKEPAALRIRESDLPEGTVVLRHPTLGIPLVLIPTEERRAPFGGGFASSDFHSAVANSIDNAVVKPNLLVFLLLRGTPLDRFGAASAQGVDVEPTDAVIWASDDPRKSLEYGPLLLVYQWGLLDRPYRQVPLDTSPEELGRLRRTFPHITPLPDGSGFWLSRIPESDPRRAYERDYAWWIPGDPLRALRAIIAVGTQTELCRRVAALRAGRSPARGGDWASESNPE